MVDKKYEIAMAEVLHYLKGIRKEDIEKIPSKLMDFFKDNSSKDYVCKFDYTKTLNDLELDLKDETRGLIAMICLNYWCETEEKKRNFIKKLNQNEIAYQEELRKKYNPDNIFKNNREESIINNEKHDLIVYNQRNVVEKIFDKIKKYIEKIIPKTKKNN